MSYIALAAVTALTIIGDYALKAASGLIVPWFSPLFFLGAAMYALSAIGWVVAMTNLNLAQIGSLYSCATILCLTAMGYFVFDERVSARQILAVLAALVSIVLADS